MIKANFICAINCIEIIEDLGIGIEIIPNKENENFPKIFLTNNKEIIRKQLISGTEKLIGLIEYRHLYNNAKLVAYSNSEFDENQTNSIQHLDIHLSILKIFFFSLWMVKDNSVDFDLGFLIFKNPEDELETSSNLFTSGCFNVLGKRELTEFTKDEVNQASIFLNENIKIEVSRAESTASVKKYSRVTIANYYIQHARSSNDIGLKFASYCSALETLFSNDSTELSHKLSERVSRFLKKTQGERIEIFKIIKQSYNIRSKVVHGESFKDGQVTEMEKVVVELDNICREIMDYSLKIEKETNVFYKNNEDMERYFLELIME